MSWPTLQDYNEAIQNPKTAFSDAELRSGIPELTNLGMPRAIAGGFATVYRLKCGGKDYAVRCFSSNFADQQQRYATISQSLSQAKLPYTVGFMYLPQGIRVSGQWYPILKMEWVEGELLNRYIERNLADEAALSRLAERWIVLIQDLHRASIAHGDLQHGNIIISGGGFKLIDYDGMYVPNFGTQFSSHEEGHRNYQHPKRKGTDFNEDLDNFSAWVIYLSLVTLSVEPNAWQAGGADGECLLLRKEDFESPSSSATLLRLQRHQDVRLAVLSNQFAQALQFGPTQVPRLEQAIAAGRSSLNTEWIKGHLGQAPVSRPLTSAQSIEPGQSKKEPSASDWVIDNLALNQAPRRFTGHHVPARLCVAVTAITTTTLPLTLAGVLHVSNLVYEAGIAFPLLISTAGLTYVSYVQQPAVKDRKLLNSRLRKEQQLLISIEQRLNANENSYRDMKESGTARQNEIILQRRRIEEQEQRELLRIDSELAATPSRKQLEALDKYEKENIATVQISSQAAVQAIDNAISSLASAELDELSSRLRQLQDEAIAYHVQMNPISTAWINGIGDSIKANLVYCGIRNAFDVSYDSVIQVYGIGDGRAYSLMGWALSVLNEARSKAPTSLPQHEAVAISRRYQSKMHQLQEQRKYEIDLLHTSIERIKTANVVNRQRLQHEEHVALQYGNQRKDEIKRAYHQQYILQDSQLATVNLEYAKQRKELEKERQTIQQDLFTCQWRVKYSEHELRRFDNILLWRFIAALLIGQH